jgi:hypothetical protein
MYFFAWLLWRKWKLFGGRPARWALPIAVLVEAAWEVVENTPDGDRPLPRGHRQLGLQRGFDRQLGADIGWMIVGFLVATRLPALGQRALAVLFELLTLWTSATT